MLSDVLWLLGADAEEAVKDIRNSFYSSFRPSFAGIESTSAGIGRGRIYFRSYQLSRHELDNCFDSLGLAGFKQNYARFHEIILGSRDTYFPRTSVVSIDVPANPGEPYGIKIEICPRLYLEDDRGVNQRISRLAHELMIDVTPYEQMLDVLSDGVFIQGAMHYHDVIGIGFKPGEGTRLNIYLRPNLRRYFKTQPEANLGQNLIFEEFSI